MPDPDPLRPTNKVSAAALAGALSVLLVGILSRAEVELSAVEAQAVTVIVMFVTAYFVKD